MTLNFLDYQYVRSVLYSIAALVIFYVLFRVLRYGLDILEDRLQQWKGTKIRDLKFQRVTILTENQIYEVLENLVFISRWIGNILLLLFWITATLSFYPDTEELSKKVWRSVFDPVETTIVEILHYLPKLILIGIIIFFTRFVLKGVRFFFSEIERGSIVFKNFHKDWATPTYQIARFFILIFAFIIVIPNLPASGSDSFKGVSIFVGILVSLGSTTAIGNIVAGIVLTYMRPFKVGDFVTIDNSTGEVVEKSLLMTRLMTQKKEEVTIPNLKILSHHLINYSTSAKKEGILFYTKVSVSYEHPWEKVVGVLMKAARNTTLIEQEPEPFVLQAYLKDFCAVYELNVHTKKPELMSRVYSELMENISKAMKEAGIDMVTPVVYSKTKDHEFFIR